MSDTTNPQNVNYDIDSKLNMLIKKEGRLDWDNYFISIALLAAKRSSCNRLHVGCIIVKNNRLLATGYNGFLKGAPHISRVIDNHEQFTVHAEQNAICDSANRGISLEGSTAYITHCPCLTCFKLLIASGIKEVKYLLDYKNNPLNLEMSKENNINLIKLNI